MTTAPGAISSSFSLMDFERRNCRGCIHERNPRAANPYAGMCPLIGIFHDSMIMPEFDPVRDALLAHVFKRDKCALRNNELSDIHKEAVRVPMKGEVVKFND